LAWWLCYNGVRRIRGRRWTKAEEEELIPWEQVKAKHEEDNHE
jgi:hypothetical protein